jgi:membrane associated rhomboid family serine protease
MNLIDEIKSSFKEGSSLTKLIYLNLGVFLAVKIAQIFFILFDAPQGFESFLRWFAVPAYLQDLIRKPWTLLSYMFLHEGFLHILFNMLWLFWFGRIFLEYLDQKKLVSVYLLGGITGAILYIISFNLFPVFRSVVSESVALGASASVIAVVIAITAYVPNHTVYLMFIGPVKIKYIGIIIFVVTSVLDFSTNTGGKIAHIGGAILGFIYTSQFRKGKDIGKWINRFIDQIVTLFKPGKRMKVTHKKPTTDYEYNKKKAREQEEINRILDKISKGGYESLTKDEKETLFKASNK